MAHLYSSHLCSQHSLRHSSLGCIIGCSSYNSALTTAAAMSTVFYRTLPSILPVLPGHLSSSITFQTPLFCFYQFLCCQISAPYYDDSFILLRLAVHHRTWLHCTSCRLSLQCRRFQLVICGLQIFVICFRFMRAIFSIMYYIFETHNKINAKLLKIVK